MNKKDNEGQGEKMNAMEKELISNLSTCILICTVTFCIYNSAPVGPKLKKKLKAY